MKKILFILFLLSAAIAHGQQTVVVIDESTGMAISHASLYCKEKGKFRSTTTDYAGRAKVGFGFKRLTVSHLNYEKTVVSRLDDTIRLTPKYYQTAEVVVSHAEPAWIRPMLRKFVKQKKERYYNKPESLGYKYTTQSIAGTSFYRYESDGIMEMIHPKEKHYNICQSEGRITSADSTMLTDVTNLRRILYEDFVSNFDREFITDHKFIVNEDYDGEDNEVELAYRSKKKMTDRGRFVIDTARCLILQATRVMDVKANQKYKMSAVMVGLARALWGYEITEWDVDYGVSYRETGGSYFPKEVRYKMFMRGHEDRVDSTEVKFREATGGGFSNMEATLTLGEPSPVSEEMKADTARYKRLLPPWYIKYNTDADRAYEISLSHLPAQFCILKDE